MVRIIPLPFAPSVIAPRETTGLFGDEPDVYDAGPPIGGAFLIGAQTWQVWCRCLGHRMEGGEFAVAGSAPRS